MMIKLGGLFVRLIEVDTAQGLQDESEITGAITTTTDLSMLTIFILVFSPD